jgi:hypothetical protein
MALKKFMPEVRFNSEKVDPDEINMYQQYTIACPGTTVNCIGTAAGGTWVQTKSLVILNQALDYPRNLFLSITNTAGSLNGGSVYVVGKDQWGNSQTETIGYNLGTATQGISGTKIFSQVTAGTVTFGSAQLNAGSATLGVACGTAAGSNVFAFGLPWRLGAKTDIKNISYVKNFVPTVLNAGTPSDLITLDPPSFTGTVILGTADFFSVTALPTYNGEATDQVK